MLNLASVLALAATLVTGNWEKGASTFALSSDGQAVGIEAKTKAEALEFFFIPDGGAFEYYVFRVARDGKTDQRFYSEFGGIEPDPFGALWSARVTSEKGDAWSVTASIPYSGFYLTRAGNWKTDWRVNAASYDADGKASIWAGAEPPDAKGKFLNAFRKVSGFPSRTSSEDFFVKSAVARVTGLRDGKPAGKLRLEVQCWRSGTFTFAADGVKPTAVKLPFGGDRVELDAVFPGDGRHRIRIGVKDDAGRTFGRTWPLYVDFHPITLKLTTPQYRANFYPGQPSAVVAGRVSSLSGKPVTLTLEGAGVAKQTKTVVADGSFSFDTKGLPAGGEVTLTTVCGTDTLTKRIRRLKPLPDGRAMTWIENGNLVLNGKPVVRRGIYATGFMGGKAFAERFAADDLFLTTNIECIANLDPGWYSKDLRRNEMKLDQKPSARMREWLDRNIARGLATTNGCYYYICDEPECAGVSPVQLRHIYEYVAERDPYHVIASCCRSGETYVDVADWFETHPYLNPHFDAEGNRVYGRDFRDLGSFVDAFKPAEHPEKCIGGTPTCFAYSLGDYPTFDEYVLNYWCEFVRGAKTMYAYAYHDLGDRPSLYDGTRYMFESMKALEDVLLFGRIATLAKTPDGECGLWTMPAGDRMFAAVNFTQKPLKLVVPGLEGNYREFRGTRTFRLSSSQPTTFDLRPHESLIACEKARDAGLRTHAEVAKAVADAEYARTHRGNQLGGRHRDMDVVTSFGRRGAWRDDAIKVFDGTLDVIAWRDEWSKEKFFEMAFTKFVPTFDRLDVYGHNIDGVVAKIRENGAWKTLEPVSVEKDRYRRTLKFGRPHTTVKLRLEFPLNHVELYEVELPGEAREIAADAPQPEPKGVRWTLDTKTFNKHTSFPIRQPAERTFLTFTLDDLMLNDAHGYVNWQIHLNPEGGTLCAEVTHVLPGLYTLALPASPTGKERDASLYVYDWNVRFGMGKVVCSDAPANSALLTEEDGDYRVRVALAAPCEDVVCSFYEDLGRGQRPFQLSNGLNSLDLKPADATRTVWVARVPVAKSADAKRRPFPYVRVNALGGTLTTPIYTWLAK